MVVRTIILNWYIPYVWPSYRVPVLKDAWRAISSRKHIYSPVNSAVRPLCYQLSSCNICFQRVANTTSRPLVLAAGIRRVLSANPSTRFPYILHCLGPQTLVSNCTVPFWMPASHNRNYYAKWIMLEMVSTFLRTAYMYIQYIYSLQYVIDTFLRLDGTYQDVLLTCYSLTFAIIPETHRSWTRRCASVSFTGQTVSLKQRAPTLLMSQRIHHSTEWAVWTQPG
jgi:hypothetical protein